MLFILSGLVCLSPWLLIKAFIKVYFEISKENIKGKNKRAVTVVQLVNNAQ